MDNLLLNEEGGQKATCSGIESKLSLHSVAVQSPKIKAKPWEEGSNILHHESMVKKQIAKIIMALLLKVILFLITKEFEDKYPL